MKKLWDVRICLIYRGIGLLYNDLPEVINIMYNYFNKRYFAEMIHINDNKEIIIITKLEKLFLTENESKMLYNEFKKNNNFE